MKRLFSYFETLVDPYAPYPREDHPPQTLARFMGGYARPFRRIFAVTALFSVLVAGVEIALIWLMGWIVDILQGDPAQVWADHGAVLIGLAVFILLIRPAIQLIDVMLLNNAIMPNFGSLIRWRAHGHVMRQSVGWFENDFAGRIANRIMQTPPAAGEAVFQIFDAITFSIAYVAGALLVLWGADWRLVLPLLAWLVAYGALMRWTIVRVGPASQRASDARSAITGRVVDSYTNIHAVKMFARHEAEMDYAGEAIEHARRTFQDEMRIYTVMDFGLVVLNGILIVGVVGLAVALWMQGQASVGVVAAATALALRLNAMTGWIMWALTTLFRQLGVVKEGMETIAQPIDLVDVPGARELEMTTGEIVFDGVRHHYGRGAGGLDAVDLTIAPGEKVGLVGRSGAGKSTLVKLLLRFYDLEGGAIRIDGQDIAEVGQDSLRAAIGVVQQDSALLHRSVRDNIRYGRPDASEDEILRAARQAEAHDFILELQDAAGHQGYDAHVGERGVKLSGGQRQRITLARAILKDAPVLVLDEATSALDSEVEAAIQDTLYAMMDGKSVIAIAHRLSTIAHMDRIVVLDQGRVAEQGSHAELLERGGIYAGLWARQSGGFLGDDRGDDQGDDQGGPGAQAQVAQ
ncbi:ABC transporter ATP-binding protein [Rhodalgimonas zhirmunskyi]|uniref:ABC transporter ATP-binding protein/permease n=1 Tax=Rhodalgimonas zhirmunskyi TaxID=2964767 RepID=A0AAJ1UEW3_9RHOB|nr:ABC transporter ATP-binding protein [Rhodoalgimonas zhirmunskyi]MDQ2094782.1 ABC transporter ATP-binding protein/permease [Rhodoalgimonas zhirmunskyi]